MLRIDDALGEFHYAQRFEYLLTPLIDLAAEHAMGGIIGLLWNALFADKELIALDGINTTAPGGWLNGHWKQLYMQFAYVVATCAYTFVVTALLAKGLDSFPLFRLRASPEEEALGMDDTQVSSTAPFCAS